MSNFYRVRCECKHEQIVFSHATERVKCQNCGKIIAEPTGGKAVILARIVEEVDARD